MLFLIPLPIGTILVLLVCYSIVTSGHFLLFVSAVGAAAAVGMLFVRWCWDCRERRRAARSARLTHS